MWLIAESELYNSIEYWLDGKCVLKIPVDSDDFRKLNTIKDLLKEVKARWSAADA